jgi:perosamine synthetase
MSSKKHSRRDFLVKNATGGLGALLAPSLMAAGGASHLAKIATEKPAILGGSQAWSNQRWPSWPRWVPETDEPRVLQVLRSGVWSRAGVVSEFEKEWANTIGTKRCLTLVNGTNALVTALAQLGVGAGDEVLVPPYTFISTVTAVLSNNAIPVFVDIDPLTYQMDPAKIEAKITPRTKVILPVHIMGLPADMKRINAIAKKHKLFVLEDACQAHLAEIDGKKVGSFGDAGCFSFQNSKNLAIGEGGAIVSNDDKFMDKCFSYQNLGNPYGTAIGAVGAGSIMQGTKLRLSEYQAAVGLALLKRLEDETTIRNENAAYLSKLLADVPGIIPQKTYADTTRGAYHLYAMRFKSDAFKGLSRDNFMKALRAEGVPASGGYAQLNIQPFLAQTFGTQTYRKIYSKNELDIQKYNQANRCPENVMLCNEAVWFTQNMLLAERKDMEFIAAAVHKTYNNADKLKASLK